jgi:integrase
MKQIAPHLFSRGKVGSIYLRLRIPQDLKTAYPAKCTHIVFCLGTCNLGSAKKLQLTEEVRIEAEFSRHREELRKKKADRAVKRLDKMSDDVLKSLADHWVRQVLLTDEHYRELDSEDEFEEKGCNMTEQRAELGRMLAMRRSDKILPAMHSFIHLCGLEVDMSPEESKRAGSVFLTAVCTALDFQSQRQRGEVVQTDKVAPANVAPRDLVVAQAAAEAKKISWDAAFVVWRDYVPGRPKSTAIATQTPYLELQRLAAEHGIQCPEAVTPELMRLFVDQMSVRGLAVVTLNERLAKVKALFKVLKGKGVMSHNPAADTLGLKENSYVKRRDKRQPFDQDDLTNIFSSCIFNEKQLRSRGQSKEGSYWIPILMYYTGARTEEIAGLALSDVVQDPKYGWYLNLIDRPSADDDLFDDEENGISKAKSQSKPTPKSKPTQGDETQSHSRLLKNGDSVRRVPVAPELIELGLLRYMDFVRGSGQLSLFPSLIHDWHEKLSGAFGKFFGHYKKDILRIDNPKKVLYSFRHTMKDAMTRANVDSMYLQRVLGHASGLGTVTDGYGIEDVPLDVLTAEFAKIKFYPIPAQPWLPGKGAVKYPKAVKKKKGA